MTQSDYKPSVRQNVAAWTMVVGGLLSSFLRQFGYRLLFDGYYDATFHHVVGASWDVLMVASWLLLALSASNLSGRLLGFVAMGFWAVDIVFVFVSMPMTFWYVYSPLVTLVYVWLFSVLLKNNRLTTAARSWGHLYILGRLMGLGYFLYLTTDSHFRPYTWSSEYLPFYVFDTLITYFALWHIARSRAFGGQYDRSARVSLAPGLKPSLAFGIGLALMLLMIQLIYGVA